MSDTFNPYHKWLGIPPAHQPADHYRLLGIEQFEGDADVISLAADQRMTFLRTFQSSEQSELSQRLLNEVAVAKICLLNAKEKARYDAELARKKPPDAPPPLPAGDDSQGAFATFAVGSQTDSASSRSRGSTQDKAGLRKKKTRVPVVGIAVVILLLIVLVGLIFWGKEKKEREQIGRTAVAQRKETPTKPSQPAAKPKDEGLQIPTFAEPRKKTPTKPPQPAAKPAAGSATVTKTTVTKTIPRPPVAPNAPQGPAKPLEEELARTRLTEKYHLEEDASAHTWSLVNEQTRKLEALETSGPSGVVGGPEFEAELKRRIKAKKEKILDRWSKIYNAKSDNGGPLDKEWNHNVNQVMMFSQNPDVWYVRDGIPEITSIRAQVEREFASRGPATTNPAKVGLLKDIRNRYATLAADPKVAKLLEQADGKLAQPPGEPAGANLSLADAQTVGSRTTNEAEQAQGAGKKKAETQLPQVLRRLQPLPDSPRSPLIRRGLVEENGVWKHQQEIAEATLQNTLLQRQIDLSPRQQELLEQFIDEYRTQTEVEFEVLAADALERRAKVGQTAPVPFSPEGWKRFHFLARYHPDVTAGEFGVPQESSARFFQKAIAKALKLHQGTPQWTAAASLYRNPNRELFIKQKRHHERQQNLYSIYTALAKDPQVKKALRTLGHQLATVPPPPNLNGDPPPPVFRRKKASAILSKGPANDRDFEHHFVENNGKWQHLEEPRIAADLNEIRKQVAQYKAAVKDQIENSKKIQVLQVQLRKVGNFSAAKRRVLAKDIHRATVELQRRKDKRHKIAAETRRVATLMTATRQRAERVEALTQKYHGYTYREGTPIEIKTNVKKLTTAIDRLAASFTKITTQLKKAAQ